MKKLGNAHNMIEQPEVSPHLAAAYTKLYSRIESFGQLKKNWNGYGANAPSPNAIILAKETLNLCLQFLLILSTSVEATGDESILFEARKDNLRLMIEIFSDGEISLLTSDSSGDHCRSADLQGVSKKLAQMAESDGAKFTS